MALETFVPPIPPSPGTRARPKVRLLKAEFGDGYTQTTRDGINHIRKTLELEWETLTPAQAKQITDFLERHGGDIPFYYTPSNETVPIKWTCEEWEDTRGQGGLRTVTCTFEQSFSLES